MTILLFYKRTHINLTFKHIKSNKIQTFIKYLYVLQKKTTYYMLLLIKTQVEVGNKQQKKKHIFISNEKRTTLLLKKKKKTNFSIYLFLIINDLISSP